MILIIDNYDSFTYNLVQAIGELHVECEMKVLRNDAATVEDLASLKPEYIIISPGPGTPGDAGVSVDLVRHFAGRVPILGVCLGHQCVGQAFGGEVIEAEIAMLDPTDRSAFLSDLGLEAPARERLIKTCYQAAGLISFLTMNPQEVRAWTVPKGTTAVEAAAKVHTDFARGFIRAETIAFDDLVAHKDMKGAKAAGRIRKEGKTYVVADGDILNILANP